VLNYAEHDHRPNGNCCQSSDYPTVLNYAEHDHRPNGNWKKAWGWLELQAEQRSKPWFDARRCCVTGSVAKKAMGWSSVTYDPKDKVVNEICGRLPPTVVNTDMQRGIDNEDPLRKLFMQRALPHLTCYEPSLCMGTVVYDFPILDPNSKSKSKTKKLLSELYGSMMTNPYHPQWFIGASPDGIILGQDGNPIADLECKVPQYCYPNMTTKLNGEKYPTEYWLDCKFDYMFSEEEIQDARDNEYPDNYFCIYTPLKLEHFCQVYGQMAITNIHHAYYLVGFTDVSEKDLNWVGKNEGSYFPLDQYTLQRECNSECDSEGQNQGNNESKSKNVQLGYSYCELDFDQRLWQTKMYPHIVDFITNDLIPALTDEERDNHERKVAELLTLCKPQDFKVVPWLY
jgi:hypothetical protein